MAYKNLTAPVTNPAAAQRLADTQAIRARAAVGQAPQGTSISQAAQQTGAALTQATGQQSLQQQQQQAGIAKGQAQNVLASQRLKGQEQVFGQEQALAQSNMKLDQSLANISEEAANEEHRLRTSFNDRVAQTGYLQELDLLNWALADAKNEQDFKSKIQVMEQAHAKKVAMTNHAYKLVMQKMKQEYDKASAGRRQEIDRELARIKTHWAEERRKQENEAANRQAMVGAASTILGAGIGAGLAVAGLGPAGVAIGSAVGAGMQGTGFTKNLLGGFK